MGFNKDRNRMTELVEQLNRYRDAYYNQNKSLISDREYDALFDETSTHIWRLDPISAD